jgi:hypothetical protein
MHDYLEILKKESFDVIHFINSKEEDSIEIITRSYTDEHEYIEESPLGKKYHILLFKEDEKGNVANTDKFEAILIEPLEYISTLILQNWCGIIAKKTNKSGKYIDDLFDKMTKV